MLKFRSLVKRSLPKYLVDTFWNRLKVLFIHFLERYHILEQDTYIFPSKTELKFIS